jgi:hypothetical protein
VIAIYAALALITMYAARNTVAPTKKLLSRVQM